MLVVSTVSDLRLNRKLVIFCLVLVVGLLQYFNGPWSVWGLLAGSLIAISSAFVEIQLPTALEVILVVIFGVIASLLMQRYPIHMTSALFGYALSIVGIWLIGFVGQLLQDANTDASQ